MRIYAPHDLMIRIRKHVFAETQRGFAKIAGTSLPDGKAQCRT